MKFIREAGILVLIFVALFLGLAAVPRPATATMFVPGQCSAGVTYTQSYRFFENACITNDNLRQLSNYNACDVHVTYAKDDYSADMGYYVFYKVPATTKDVQFSFDTPCVLDK